MMPDEQKTEIESQKTEAEPQEARTTQTVRSEDFRLIYANNAYTEATAWDLKITFSRFEENAEGQPTNNKLVAVTMPFGAAKLMLYWMEATILAHEFESGHPVGIRENLLPPPPQPLSDELKKNPVLVKYHDAITKLHERLLASI